MLARLVFSAIAIACGGTIASALAADPKVSLEADGVRIETPQDGPFTLSYPLLRTGPDKSVRAESATIAKNVATAKYPGGGRVSATHNGDSITLHFTDLPADAKGLRMEMPLPIGLAEKGKWQIEGEPVQPFPAKFAGAQHVFKGNPQPVKLICPGGAAFTLSMPHGWQELQDNRMWNTQSFIYVLSADMPREGQEAYYTFRVTTGDKKLTDAPPPRPAAPAKASLALKLTSEGVNIDAGSLGHFKLEYPVLVGDRWDDIRKPIERQAHGNAATVRFDGGASIAVNLEPGTGEVTLTPANLPSNAKSLKLEMLIDFSYANGGFWKAGNNQEVAFPATKPAKPFLFQDHADGLVLRDAQGATLSIQTPPHSYQQLTDNREWGWKIFGWHFSVPNPGNNPLKVKIAVAAATSAPQVAVDKFGQNIKAKYVDKITSEDQLKQDIRAEQAFAASLQPPARDPYGGLLDSGKKLGLKTTGFFHVEKKSPGWILVDPVGNAVFHLGVCGFQPSEDYTFIQGREYLYEWLPPHSGAFASAWHPDKYWGPLAVSFHLANRARKTGQPHAGADYTAQMIDRVRRWGFNAAGAFGSGDEATRVRLKFPAATSLPLSTWDGFPELPGAHGAFDPFEESIRAQCDKQFAAKVAPRADDPLIVGYFLNNEPLYEQLPAGLAALDGKHACKQQLAKMLETKYKTIDAFNQAWKTSFASFADVAARGLPVTTPAAKADIHEFTGIFLDAYFKLVSDTFHKYDKNHLLIGNRLQPGTINNEQLCRLSGKYLDIMSFNYYTYHLDKEFLGRIYDWTGGRPMILSEFYYNSPTDSGLPGGGKDVNTQQERGLAYRNYVEQAASLGYVVGIEWFTLVDQSVTGRFFEKLNGENANTGLIAVTDRPWQAMLAEMIKTNYTIYEVEFRERPPFEFRDSRFVKPTK